MPSVSRSERRWDPIALQTYQEALALAKSHPHTVCTTPSHYQDNRHPVPYRMGFCHHYREPAEHYHARLPELQRCTQ